jgi:predicted dehydrogenase
VPTMRVKTFPGTRSWWEPFETSTESVDRSDPLAHQVRHFVDVIRGDAEPICSGRDGLRTLVVVDAVLEAARTGAPVDVVA